MKRICIFALLFFPFQLFAQQINEALALMDSDPARAYQLASTYKIPSDIAEGDAHYHRFLKFYIMLNNPAMNARDFEQEIKADQGQMIYTSEIWKETMTEGKGGWGGSFTDKLEIRVADLDTGFYGYAPDNMFVFQGKIKNVEKNGEKYVVSIEEATYLLVDGSAVVPDEEHNELINAMDQNNWDRASELAADYTGRFISDYSGRQAWYRGMYLTALAGLVNARKKTGQEALEIMQQFEGKAVSTLYYEISMIPMSPGTLSNYNEIKTNFSTGQVTVRRGNQADSWAFQAVIAQLKEKFNLAAGAGKSAAIVGTLGKVELRTEDQRPIFYLHLNDAQVVVLEQ